MKSPKTLYFIACWFTFLNHATAAISGGTSSSSSGRETILPCLKSVTTMIHMFQKFQDLDSEICEASENLLNTIINQHNGMKRHKNALKNYVYAAGSLAEGSTAARIFQENKNFQGNLNRETELDINYILMEIPETRKDVITDIIGKKGYVNVQLDHSLLKTARSLGWEINDDYIMEIIAKTTTKDGLLKSYKFKEETLGKVEFKNSDRAIELIIAAALNKRSKDIEIVNVTEAITGASVASEYCVKVEGKPFLKVSVDTATLIRLPWWPLIGDEWKHRKRNWPSQEKIDELSRRCFLITKPSEKDNMETTELRYSFGHIEKELVRMRDRHQNLIYLIFKSMFYKWIKPINHDKISSYIVKTIMLWMCEQFPPEHEMWNQDSNSVIKVLRMLFGELHEAFDKKDLKCYFIQEINILEGIPVKDMMKANGMIINEILTDLQAFLLADIEKEMQAGKEILEMIKSTAKVLDKIERKDFSMFLKSPYLIEDALLAYINTDDFKHLKEKLHREKQRIVRQVSDESERIVRQVSDESERIVRQVSDEAARFEKRLRKLFK